MSFPMNGQVIPYGRLIPCQDRQMMRQIQSWAANEYRQSRLDDRNDESIP